MSRSPAVLLGRSSELRARQAGVVTRRQLVGLGHAPHELDRLVRRRLLAPFGRGVLLDHTGEPSWEQRSWGAVLALWPAALGGLSALRAAEGTSGPRTSRSRW